MKRHTFGKLKSAIALLTLMPAFLASEKISSRTFAAENRKRADAPGRQNNFIKNYDADEDEIFFLVNDERQKQNLNILIWDNQLAEIARNYSGQMADGNFFDHFDPQGADVVLRAKKSNLKHWSKIGENLFSIEGMKNFDAFAVKNWMESPTHRQNILDADFNKAGIGIAESDGGEIFITEVFIRR